MRSARSRPTGSVRALRGRRTWLENKKAVGSEWSPSTRNVRVARHRFPLSLVEPSWVVRSGIALPKISVGTVSVIV